MKQLIFRVSIIRSNPVWSTDLLFTDKHRVEDLIKTIGIAFGMQKQLTGYLCAPAAIIPLWNEAEKQIKTITDMDCVSRTYEVPDAERIGADTLLTSLKDSLIHSILPASKELPVSFRVSFLAENTSGVLPGSDLPLIDRFVKWQLPEDCISSVRDLNKIVQAWKYSGYYYTHGNYVSEKQYQLKQTTVATRLKCLFDPDYTFKEINYCKTFRYADHLEGYTVAELKELAQVLDDYIYPYQRKQQLIKDIVHSVTQKKAILRYFTRMSLKEFSLMEKLCYGETLDNRLLPETDLPVLFQYELVTSFYPQGIMIAREIVEFYDSWHETEEGSLFTVQKQLDQLIRFCKTVYFVFSKPDLKEVRNSCCKEITDSQIDTLFDSRLKAAGLKRFSHNNTAYYYSNDSIKEQDVKALLQNPGFISRNLFLPDEKQLAAYQNGLLFEEDKSQQIENFLSKTFRINFYDSTFLREQLAAAISSGASFDDLVAYLCSLRALPKITSKKDAVNEFRALYDKYAGSVRLVLAGGFTANEIKRRFQNTEKKTKVFPNDPCPCGSGLKYKYCCGKK